MKTIELTGLPPGSEIRGRLYDDPAMKYLSGDVLEVELPNGLMIDVGWDEDAREGAFRIAVYREYFGDRFVDIRVREAGEVALRVAELARKYSQPVATASGSSTN
jgi:hypothetical protein